MARGHLRIYLGAAPGVGKTYAMLAEGQRRRSRGTDLVIGLVETHGRRLTTAMAQGLEMVPRRAMTYRGAAVTEMDTDAVLARHPQSRWSMSWRTRTCPAAATPSGGRTSMSCSTPASTSSPR
jgi:K+-sensing histidine kinase KdpD